MAYEQRSGDIAIFQETDKKSDKAPDWKGTMIVPEGVGPGDKLEIALWSKGNKGTMLAGQAKEPRQRQESGGFQSRDNAASGGGGGGFSGGGSQRQERPKDPWGDDGDPIPFSTLDSIR